MPRQSGGPGRVSACADELRPRERQAYLSRRAQSTLDILVAAAFLEKKLHRASRAFPGVTALDSAGAISKKRLASAAADLD